MTSAPTRRPVDRRPVSVLTVESRKNTGGDYRLSFQLHTHQGDDSGSWSGVVESVDRPLDYFAEFFGEVNRTKDKDRVVDAITTQGATMSERLLPADVRVPLVRLAARGDPLLVVTDDPWIPWEFLLIQGEHNQFLCEMCDLTRWFLNVSRPRELTLRHLGLIVPSDSKLSTAEAEKSAILGHCRNGRAVTHIPATRPDVRAAFQDARQLRDWWHFTGHGQLMSPAQRRAAIVLERGDPFHDEELNVEANRNCGRLHPLVFWNACRSGTGTESLTGVGGWAHGFVRLAGAAAFIGTLWNVFDEGAFLFATTFYRQLIERREPIGRAIRRARAAVKATGDPSWLGYAVYADPYAGVVSNPTDEGLE